MRVHKNTSITVHAMICDQCKTIPLDLFNQRNSCHVLHPSKAALEASATAGCVSCALFLRSFSDPWAQRSRVSLRPFGNDSAVILRNYESLVFVTCGENARSPNYDVGAVARFISMDSNKVNQLSEGRFSVAADSDENVQMIRRWIDECDQNHLQCSHSSKLPLPTRLLELSSDPGDARIRLVDGAAVASDDAQYCTLSHCWGATQEDAPWKLKKSNLESFKNHISHDEIPPTYQDAINMTLRLGYHYLWIDSLCIIQDSSEDWERESASMYQIYLGASCALISASASSRDGLFPRRNLEDLKPVQLRIDSPASADPTFVTLWSRALFRAEILSAIPATSRAWCLQERELSRRAVQFTPHEILWNCFTHHTSESVARRGGEPDYHDEGSRVAVTLRTFEGLDGQLEYYDTSEPSRSWFHLVEEFNARGLTFERDKFPALSGVAQLLASRAGLQDQYVAGIWKTSALRGLLWTCLSPGRRPSAYIAPSWSWASVTADVMFQLKHMIPSADIGIEPCAEVLEMRSTVEGLDPFGVIIDAVLCLRGPACTGICRQKENANLSISNAAMVSQELSLPLHSIKSGSEVGRVVFDSFQDYLPEQTVLCLLLFRSDIVGSMGLALVPAEKDGRQTTQYKRVGSVHLLEDEEKEWMSDFKTTDITII